MTAALVGAGESDQLRALHDQHAHALWSNVVGLTGGDHGKAQDVVQETLLRVWRNLAGGHRQVPRPLRAARPATGN